MFVGIHSLSLSDKYLNHPLYREDLLSETTELYLKYNSLSHV